MKTQDNLMSAFAGESQANRKYLAFANKAEKEGYKNVARVFRAIAEAETIHALKHLEVAGKVGSTAENLATAVAGEHHEFTEMYPEFITQAKADEQASALRTFELALGAEKVHGKFFEELKALVDQQQDLPDKELYLCPVCGWVGSEPAPERCPVCNALAKIFRKL